MQQDLELQNDCPVIFNLKIFLQILKTELRCKFKIVVIDLRLNINIVKLKPYIRFLNK